MVRSVKIILYYLSFIVYNNRSRQTQNYTQNYAEIFRSNPRLNPRESASTTKESEVKEWVKK